MSETNQVVENPGSKVEEAESPDRPEPPIHVRKFVNPEFVFGLGARKLAGQYAKKFEPKKILVVSDPGVVAAGWTDDVCATLEDAGLPYLTFTRCTPNPKAEEVMDGVEVYKREGCTMVMSVGGGSVIDCAKGIAVVVADGRHILQYEGVDQIKSKKPPLICIPTTGGTSSDVSQFAIITNMDERVKIAIISSKVVPDVSLIDPLTLTTMDPYLAACTGMDALVHAIEGFVSLNATRITDLHALEAIRLITSNIIDSLQNPDNLRLRESIMRGSLEAGLAFSNASLGGVHAMAHSLGGYRDLPHGECNAMLLRHVMDFNFNEATDRFLKIGDAMGLDLRGMVQRDKKRSILGEIDRLAKAVGIDMTLGGRGIKNVDAPQLAKNAVKDACMNTNPRKVNSRDIEVLYEEAM